MGPDEAGTDVASETPRVLATASGRRPPRALLLGRVEEVAVGDKDDGVVRPVAGHAVCPFPVRHAGVLAPHKARPPFPYADGPGVGPLATVSVGALRPAIDGPNDDQGVVADDVLIDAPVYALYCKRGDTFLRRHVLY